jgi:hypothetical protein
VLQLWEPVELVAGVLQLWEPVELVAGVLQLWEPVELVAGVLQLWDPVELVDGVLQLCEPPVLVAGASVAGVDCDTEEPEPVSGVVAEPAAGVSAEEPCVSAEEPAAEVVAAPDEAVEPPAAPPEAHTVALPGVVVKAVTVKSGVPPLVHVQHGSPKAAPFVIDAPGKVALQKSGVHVWSAAPKAVPNLVNCELSLSGWPKSCANELPFGSSSRYAFMAVAEFIVVATIRAEAARAV